MPEHPARVAAQRSMAAVSAKDRQAWLDLFTDDGCVEDPVGRSPLDEEGTGHRGKAAIGAFWDKTIALMERIDFDLIASYAAGDEVANVATITTHMPGEMVGRTDGVFVYRVDDEGRLTNLRAFWEFDAMIATIRKRS